MEIISLKEQASDAETAVQSDAYVVTAIKPQAGNNNRVNVFVNDEYDFSLDIAQVVDYKLKVKRCLTELELSELRNASEFGKLYQRALEKTLSRPHSVKEIRDYLDTKRKKRIAENKIAHNNRKKDKELVKKYKLKVKEQPIYSDETIEKIIGILVEKGYLDDRKFAEYYVANRNQKKGTSLKKLRLELNSKGISEEICEQVLAESGRNDVEEIKKIIKKKAKHYDMEKMTNYLIRQGFDYQLVRDLLQEQAELLGKD